MLDFFYSLPDNEERSEEEPDDISDDECRANTSLNGSLSEERRTSIPETDESIAIQCSPDLVHDSPRAEDLQTLTFCNEPNENAWEETVSEYFDNISNPEKTPGPKADFGKYDKECDYFFEFFDDHILDHIVKNTNLYAKQERPDFRSLPSGVKKNNNWTDITISEMKAYFGSLILMGIHQLPHLANYWSSDPILRVEAVSKIMTLKRFKKITENIHLNDNLSAIPKSVPGYDKLHKIRPLIDHLNQRFTSVYNHSNRLSVDEAMIPFKGRTSIKQYMPMKPVKRGYKVWCLADSKSGYLMNFYLYCGKNENIQNQEMNLGERVVMKLCQGLANSQCIVAFDNYFSTLNLCESLLLNNIYSVGTVRPNRRGLPEMIKNKDKLKRGEFMFQTKGPVAAIKWQDTKTVSVLETAVSPKEVGFVTRRNRDGSKVTVPCPAAVVMYNKIMGGVDLFDQKRERYAVGRRSLKWWHRIFYFLLDAAIVNAFTLRKLVKGNGDQLTFRIQLARQLTSGFTSKQRKGRAPLFIARKRGSVGVPDEVRMANVGDHLPKKIDNYRRCRRCSTRKEEKRTRVVCSNCNVALCLDPCFRLFHSS